MAPDIYFTTNLDLASPYLDGIDTDRVPATGERFVFYTERHKLFELEVVAVRNVIHHEERSISRIEVELHIPRNNIFKSIGDWERHFNQHILGRP